MSKDLCVSKNSLSRVLKPQQGEERPRSEATASGLPSGREFPSNVLAASLAKLPGRAIARCACVSRQWCGVAKGEAVWQEAFRRDFGPLPASRASRVVDWRKEYLLECAWRQDMNVEPRVLIDVDEYSWCALRIANQVVVGGPQYFKIWDLEKEAIACRCDVENCDICSIWTCGELLLGGDDKGNLRGWHLDSLEPVFNVKAHEATVQAIAGSREVVVTGGGDALVKLWDREVWECEKSLVGHERAVSSLCITHEGRIVSGSMDSTVRTWDPSTGACLQLLQGHEGGVLCMAVFEGVLVSGSEDMMIRAWDIQQGECLKILNGHDAEVWAVSFDGKRICSGSGDETVKVWDLGDGVCCRTFQVGEWVRGVWCDGDMLACFASSVHVWKFGQGV